MTEPRGGLRDRLLIESFYQMLHGGLEALGWFDAGRQHAPIDMRPGPVPRDEEIDYNTLVVTWEDIDRTDTELGSNAAELTHTLYIDFYAEPPPPDGMGGEALGKHLIGDVLAIVVGEFPDIGRSWPSLEVFDWTLATPTYLFTVQFDTERTRTAKVHRYDQPWERWWYTCVTEVIEDRS